MRRGQFAAAAGDPLPNKHVSDGVLGDEKLPVRWEGGGVCATHRLLSFEYPALLTVGCALFVPRLRGGF